MKQMKKITKQEIAEYIRELMQYVLHPAFISPKGCFEKDAKLKPGKVLEYDACLIPATPKTYDVSEALRALCHLYLYEDDYKIYVKDSEGFMKCITDVSELEPGLTIISEEEYKEKLGELL